MIPLCIQMLATYLKFFLSSSFEKKSDLSDFTTKCDFSLNYLRNLLEFFKCMGESYAIHIKPVSFCDFQITLENGNFDRWKGRNCTFSLTILEEIVCYFSYPSPSLILLMRE